MGFAQQSWKTTLETYYLDEKDFFCHWPKRCQEDIPELDVVSSSFEKCSIPWLQQNTAAKLKDHSSLHTHGSSGLQESLYLWLRWKHSPTDDLIPPVDSAQRRRYVRLLIYLVSWDEQVKKCVLLTLAWAKLTPVRRCTELSETPQGRKYSGFCWIRQQN